MQISAQRVDLSTLSSRLPRASRGAEVRAFCRPQSRDRGNPQASNGGRLGPFFVTPTEVAGFFFGAALWRAGHSAGLLRSASKNVIPSEGLRFLQTVVEGSRQSTSFTSSTSRLVILSRVLCLHQRHIALAPAARHKLAQPVRVGNLCIKNRERRRRGTPSTQILLLSHVNRRRGRCGGLLLSSFRYRQIPEFSLYTNDRSL